MLACWHAAYSGLESICSGQYMLSYCFIMEMETWEFETSYSVLLDASYIYISLVGWITASIKCNCWIINVIFPINSILDCITILAREPLELAREPITSRAEPQFPARLMNEPSLGSARFQPYTGDPRYSGSMWIPGRLFGRSVWIASRERCRICDCIEAWYDSYF
jgi:hypothetical protein